MREESEVETELLSGCGLYRAGRGAGGCDGAEGQRAGKLG